VDTPERRHLIAARKSVAEVQEFIGADSLAYLSLEGLRTSCGEPPDDPHYCTSCYTGKYPTNYVDLHEIRPVAELIK
jgi:amidophosphoribosyltransferase